MCALFAHEWLISNMLCKHQPMALILFQMFSLSACPQWEGFHGYRDSLTLCYVMCEDVSFLKLLLVWVIDFSFPEKTWGKYLPWCVAWRGWIILAIWNIHNFTSILKWRVMLMQKTSINKLDNFSNFFLCSLIKCPEVLMVCLSHDLVKIQQNHSSSWLFPLFLYRLFCETLVATQCYSTVLPLSLSYVHFRDWLYSFAQQCKCYFGFILYLIALEVCYSIWK